MSITKFANKLLEPLGLKPRSFAVDYTKDGQDMNRVLIPPLDLKSDREIIKGIKQIVADDGGKVTAIFELLNGYDKAELRAMEATNPQEFIKNIRILFP